MSASSRDRSHLDFVRVAAAVALISVVAFGGASATSASAARKPASTSASSVSTFDLPGSGGLAQPLNLTTNAVACSLRILPPYESGANLYIVQWDPIGLTPDPTTVALRTLSFGPSELNYNDLRGNFSVPLVTRLGPHLADPPHNPWAVELTLSSWSSPVPVFYDPAGDADVPIGYTFSTGSPTRVPLPGGHPVIATSLLDGITADQQLAVTQSVMGTTIQLEPSNNEFAQRFRVPTRTRLHFFEFVINSGGYPYTTTVGKIAVYDAQGQSAPPANLPASLVEADFSQATAPPDVWATHFPFDQLITLEPGHDYWLLLRTLGIYHPQGRQHTGTESADFTAGIGPLYARLNNGAAWAQMTAALSFRLIGEPASLLDAPPPPIPTRTGLRLVAAPNPTAASATLRWSGAVGAVKLDVLDARGRRVGGGTSTGAAQGAWTWNVRGSELPPGLYFVRARDAAGHSAIERVALIH